MKQDFIDNSAYIAIFKSNRKNAKCADLIHVQHLISNKIADDRILMQFIDKLDMVCANAENLGAKRFVLKTTTCIRRATICANPVDGKTDEITDVLTYNLHLNSDSMKMLLSYLYNIFMLIYPYSTLSFNTILSDASVKYILDKYSIENKFGRKWKYAEEITNE